MIFASVDFPQDLIDASKENRLVIFAGAGVSAGPPSQLPGFERLAEGITGKQLASYGTDKNGQEIKEPIDRFLGESGILPSQLRMKVAATISKAVDHNTVHSAVISLFDSVRELRIVTTNFDLLLEKAANEKFGDLPQVFEAPALPRGSDFRGIVHIHGSLNDQDNLILTDIDFGRAYLTEGWARRFLLDTFQSNVVLFIGYSHDDTVLQYLARALPAGERDLRFSLMPELLDFPEKWRLLGIEPLVYSQENNNDFSLLPIALQEFSKFKTRTMRDWQIVIGELAFKEPQQFDLVDEQSVDHILTDPAKLKILLEKVNSPEWLKYLGDTTLFSKTLQGEWFEQKTCEALLGCWVADNFISDNSEQFFLLYEEKGIPLAEWIWQVLARAVWQSSDIVEDNIRGWLDFLLHVAPQITDMHSLHFLAERASKSENVQYTLLFFLRMIQPRLKFLPPYTSSKQKIRVEQNAHSDYWNLNEVWKKHLFPNISDICIDALYELSGVLSVRDLRQASWDSSSNIFKHDSWSRVAIQSAEDGVESSIDVLINALRDTARQAAIEHPLQFHSWAKHYQRKDNLLIRRIVVLAIGRLPKENESLAFELLLSESLLWKDCLAETIETCKTIYPSVVKENREQLVQSILSLNGTEFKISQKFNWLTALEQTAPDCEIVQQAIAQITKGTESPAMNPTYGVRQPVKVKTYVPESNYTVTELLRTQDDDWFKKLCEIEEPASFSIWARDGLLQVITEAARKSSGWTDAFLTYLLDRDDSESDVWNALGRVLEIWPEEKQGIEYRLKILMKLENNEVMQIWMIEAITSFICSETSIHKSEFLPALNTLSYRIWQKISLPHGQKEFTNSLDSALNSAAGRLAKFWVYSVEYANKEKVTTELHSLISHLASVLEQPTQVSRDAASIFARQLRFFYSIRSEWTVVHLVPLFESEDDSVFTAIWNGFLSSAALSPELFELMKPHFLSSHERIFGLLTDKYDRYLEVYAACTLWYFDDPQAEWLNPLFSIIENEKRIIFIKEIRKYIKSKSINAQSVWSNWFEDYWQSRIEVFAMSEHDKEVREMVNFVDAFPENTSTLAELVSSMPKTKLTDSYLSHRLIKMAESAAPEDFCKVLIYCLSCDFDAWVFNDIKKIFREIDFSQVSPSMRSNLENALLRAQLPSLKVLLESGTENT